MDIMPYQKGEKVRYLPTGQILTVESCERGTGGNEGLILVTTTTDPYGHGRWFVTASSAIGEL